MRSPDFPQKKKLEELLPTKLEGATYLSGVSELVFSFAITTFYKQS